MVIIIFYFNICVKLTLSTTLNDEEMITSHLMYVMKYINSVREILAWHVYTQQNHSVRASLVIPKFNRIGLI